MMLSMLQLLKEYGVNASELKVVTHCSSVGSVEGADAIFSQCPSSTVKDALVGTTCHLHQAMVEFSRMT